MAYNKTIWTEVTGITTTLLNKIETGIHEAHNIISLLVIPSIGYLIPKNLGTASTGLATSYSREDHVHKIPTLAELSAQKTITYGTAIPSGGIDGDIYIQY